MHSGEVVGVPHVDHTREDRLRQQIDRIIAGIEPPVFPSLYGVRFVPVRLPDGDTDIRACRRYRWDFMLCLEQCFGPIFSPSTHF